MHVNVRSSQNCISYTHAHSHTHTYTYTSMHAFTHAKTHVHTCTRSPTEPHTPAHKRITHIFIRKYIHIHYTHLSHYALRMAIDIFPEAELETTFGAKIDNT